MGRASLIILKMLCFLLFTTITAAQDLPDGCSYSNYTSSYTRCQLTFVSCFTFIKFKECIKKKCERYIRAGDCRLQTSFVLQQSACYKSCCGSNAFNENQCNLYNENQGKQSNKAVVGLTVVLILTAVALLAIVIYFVVKYLKCLDKSDPFIIIRFNVKWKSDTYQDKKCQICRTYGAMMITPCNHHFHVSCFEQHCKDMNCPKCDVRIRKRMKLFCSMCREKSFKVSIKKVSEINQALTQGKALHHDVCSRQIKTATNLLKGP